MDEFLFLGAGTVVILTLFIWWQSWNLPFIFLFATVYSIKNFLVERDARGTPWRRMSLCNPLLWMAAPIHALREALETAALYWDEDEVVMPDYLDSIGVLVLGVLCLVALRLASVAPSDLRSPGPWLGFATWGSVSFFLHWLRDRI